MSMRFDLPPELPSSNYLEDPGTYHMVVTNVEEEPVSETSSKVINGFRVTFEVLEGTVRNAKGCTDIGKTLALIFWHPSPTDTENGRKWASAKQAAFLIATGLATQKSLGGSVDVNLSDAIQRQVVMSVEKGKDDKFLQLSYANIWAVDDPHAEKFPKNQKALALIGKAAPSPSASPAAKAKPAAAPAAAAPPQQVSNSWNL